MVRIYYQGTERKTDERLAGVDIRPGMAVDTTEEIAAELCGEGDYWSRVHVRTHQHVGVPLVTMYELDAPPPRDLKTFVEIGSRDLEHLGGIGPATANGLKKYGLSTLGCLADMGDEEMAEIAAQVSGVSQDKLKGWREVARRSLEG